MERSIGNMPRIIETLKSGSPIPYYATQSPKSQFTVGKIQTRGTMVWGYSGLVSYDITAAVTYPMLRFTLDSDAVLIPKFSWAGDVVFANGISIGFRVSIDGITVWEWTAAQRSAGDDPNNPDTDDPTIFLPSGRDCNIVLLNSTTPASAVLVRANCNLTGQLL